MAIVFYEDLSTLRKRHQDKKIVFCSGSFDLLHVGHIAFLEDCKKLGDILVVAVGRDQDILKNKGPDRPIHNERVRLRMVSSLKTVDYVILSKPTTSGAGRLDFLKEIFMELKPDIWVSNSDETPEQVEERKNFSKFSGVPLIIAERVSPPEHQGISTTLIIKKLRGH